MRKYIRKIGIKISLLLILFALILCVALSIFGYFSSYEAYSDFYSRTAEETAAFAAGLIDGDKIEEYYQTRVTDEYYEWLQDVLNSLKQEHNIMYLYVFVPTEELDGFTYIIEAIVETDDPEIIMSLGDLYDFEDFDLLYLVPDIIAEKPSTEKIIDSNIYGEGVGAWAPIFNSEGKFVGMVEVDMSINLVRDMLGRYMATSVAISSVIVVFMVIIMAWFNRRIVTQPLSRLTQSALNLVDGSRLSYVDEIKTGDEMQQLSEALGKMSKDIEDYTKNLADQAAERERIATELGVTSSIQASLLPELILGRDDFELCALIESSKRMGGSFFDHFFITPESLCIIIADVSGGGIPAVLFMVIAKTIIKNQLMTGMPVDKAMAVINTQLHEGASNNMTVSAFAGILDIATGLFTYVNAGQNEPLLQRRGERYTYVREQIASDLAEFRNVDYRALEINLRQGDRLLLHTDGVISIQNEDIGAFGEERLLSALNSPSKRGLKQQELLQMVLGELSAFGSIEDQASDIAMLALEYTKGDKAQADITVPALAGSLPQVIAFIKKQLSENGLGGAFYAVVALTVEELFLPVSARAGSDEIDEISVVCSVHGSRVEIRILYGGEAENFLQTAEGKDLSAIEFIRSRASELSYDFENGRNILTMVHSAE